MKPYVVFIASLVLTAGVFSGCAKKADPKRPVEMIQQEVLTMSLADLESHAATYAAAIRSEKARIIKIQDRIRKIPVDQVFSNPDLTREITEIGRKAEALFDRYWIYAQAFKDQGGDLSKIQIESPQSIEGERQ